jgi:hypothetical protein
MTDNRNGTLGLILGGIVAIAAAIFILGGGELGGATKVNSDDDLPPVATSPSETER